MIRFGNYYIGVSNNWRRIHGIPMMHTKRYRHERKDMPRDVRIKYHAMKNVGCDIEFIKGFILRHHGFDIGRKV